MHKRTYIRRIIKLEERKHVDDEFSKILRSIYVGPILKNFQQETVLERCLKQHGKVSKL